MRRVQTSASHTCRFDALDRVHGQATFLVRGDHGRRTVSGLEVDRFQAADSGEGLDVFRQDAGGDQVCAVTAQGCGDAWQFSLRDLADSARHGVIMRIRIKQSSA